MNLLIKGIGAMTDITNTPPQAAKSRRTIGMKLAISLAATILVGIAVMVYISVNSERATLHENAASFREIITRQLGAQMTGGLRWKKINAIELTYKDLVKDEASEVSNIAVYGSNYQQVTAYASDKFTNADMASINPRIAAGSSQLVDQGDHMIALSWKSVV